MEPNGHLHSTLATVEQAVLSVIRQRTDSPLSSRPREFHPQPLTEPYVKVSLHTVLRIRIISFDVHRVYILLANDKTGWVLSELYKPASNGQI